MRSALADLLATQPMLLLFVVLAVGYAAGRLRVAGVQLGIAAVLFAGLAAGALSPAFELPEFVRSFGLVIFVYAIGIASGPGFVASFRRQGLRDLAWTVGLLGLAAGVMLLASHGLGWSPGLCAGMFCGTLTNTPALAAVLERLPAGDTSAVVGYSVAYPAGALGLLLALAVARRRWRGELARTARRGELEVRFVLVTRADATATPVKTLLRQWGVRARFVRRRRAGEWALLSPDQALEPGDLVTVVGLPEALDAVVAQVGEDSDERVELHSNELDQRRIFVSSPEVAGHSLAVLRTLTRFGALVTRVRRGDADLVPEGRTVLQLGDRVRVVAPRERMAEVSRFFGDSYRALGEIDAVSFGLGIALGLLLGLVPLPLPGGTFFRLGPAGGPLVMGLLLGARGRTGPIVWQLPYSAGLTLRQLGLALFLAALGVNAGTPFVATFRAGGGGELLAVAALVTTLTATLALLSSSRWLGAPAGLAMGLTAGVHTQPAGLAFATDTTHDDSPGIGYASVSPIATVSKILLAQLLLGGWR
ncbi:MAG: TrkA C-terminal domain-containing protein [Candidatus Eisenbacteria bacterium]